MRLMMTLGFSVLVTTSAACGFGGPVATTAKPATTVQQAPQASASKPSQATASQPVKAYTAVDPCSLTTAAEMEGIVGKLRSGPQPIKAQDGEILMCKFVTDKGQIIDISVINGVNFEIHKGFVKDDKETQMVSGLGEGAFLKAMQNEYTLEILKQPYALEITMTMNREDALSFSQTIAARALPRL